MSSKAVKVPIVLLCLLALLVPSPVKSVASGISSSQITTPSAGAFVSIEVNPVSLSVGGTALVSVKLNNVPMEGYKSAEFTCTYSAGLVEKSNITFTALFGAEPVTAIHDPQTGAFIVAIAGMNSNRATTSGVAFTFSARGLQAGQSAIQCSARVSTGNNLAIDVPSIGADLTILEAQVSPTPFVPATATAGQHEHPSATIPAVESPTPIPPASLSGQFLASKPVTVRLLDANQLDILSVLANPDGTFLMTPLPGDYSLVATASGFLSYQGSLTVTAGDQLVFPMESLLAGDVDGNNVIDQFDALTIGMSYTSSTPEAADLNTDAVINFLDLELLAGNYRQIGPTTGSPSIWGFLQKKGPTPTGSPIPGLTKTVITPMATGSPIPDPKQTVIAPAFTPRPRIAGAHSGAPLCPTHDTSRWHGLWDEALGCHYDHEHGVSPFTPEVAATFPGFDLKALLGGVEIAHTNPSSPMENTHKHGGFKWQVDLNPANGGRGVCVPGFEDGAIVVKASAIQYHVFGRQDIEHEARNHSSTALLAFCKDGNPSDVGYMYVAQLQEFGQRVTPYQGFVLPYPDSFLPTWSSPRGPYLTAGCVGPNIPLPPGMSDTTTTAVCRTSLQDVIRMNLNVDSIWSSKPTGNGTRPETPKLFRMLFRIRDGYQLLDSTDLVHPFTWRFICSSDGGQSYAASMPGCRWNNSTTTIHEVTGDIPEAWDGLAGFDTDPRPGRITAQGFVTRFGDLNLSCTAAGGDCYPIKLVSAFVGRYSSELSAEKVSNPDPFNTPERDIYFCNGVPCTETSPGAVPSGWIGGEN